jgi:hypothetical protein
LAAPTKEDILKYEAAHKTLFASLVIANNLWLGMPGKYNFDPKIEKQKNSAKYKAWVNYGQQIAKTVGAWYGRQYKLEQVKDAHVEKFPPVLTYFLQPGEKQKTLNDLALKLIKPGTAGEGLGFIPLLIWGVIALIAAFSAVYIIDETTTTAQEQEHLLKTTAETLKELGIPPDKAAEIIESTQKQATENKGLLNSITGGGFSTPLLIALAAFLLIKTKNN